eukprot:TRINITY_DN8894_c0_g2_i1.p1 TRINITY_DN8894_c0_g2~~TRINITY_DN8894_c0_g2_i1.p1  ORF type:complete len:591 (+),score=103.12 TRINITY_DN8894_c0_g2_i1:42-1814(+)
MLSQFASISHSLTSAVGLLYGPKRASFLVVSRDGKSQLLTKASAVLQKSIAQHPISALLVSMSQSQEETATDGTCFVLLLTAALVDNLSTLIQNGVPSWIVSELLSKQSSHINSIMDSLKIKSLSASKDEVHQEQFIQEFRTKTSLLIKTTLQTKMPVKDATMLANVLSEATIKQCGQTMMICIQTTDPCDPEIHPGIVFDRGPAHPNMPRILSQVRVVACIEIEAKGNVSDVVSGLHIRATLSHKIQKIMDVFEALSQAGVRCIFCERSPSPAILDYASKKGILLLHSLPRDLIQQVCNMSKCYTMNTLAECVDAFGFLQSLECKKIDGRWYTFITASTPSVQTVILYIQHEDDRHVLLSNARDGLRIGILYNKDNCCLPGGGATELFICRKVMSSIEEKQPTQLGSETALVIDAISQSFRSVCKKLIENSQNEGSVLGYLQEYEAQLARWLRGPMIPEEIPTVFVNEIGCLEFHACKFCHLYDSYTAKRVAIQKAFRTASQILCTDGLLKKTSELVLSSTPAHGKRASESQPIHPDRKPYLFKGLKDPFLEQEKTRVARQEAHFYSRGQTERRQAIENMSKHSRLDSS